MYNPGARFIILLFGAPEILESAKRCKDRATNPDRVLAFGWCDDLDFHACRREASKLLLHTVCDTREHGRAAREDYVSIQVATDVEVALEDGVIPVINLGSAPDQSVSE